MKIHSTVWLSIACNIAMLQGLWAFDGGKTMEFYFRVNDNEAKQLTFDDVHTITTKHGWLNTSDYFTFTNKHDIRLHFTDQTIETVHFNCPNGKYTAEGFFFDRKSDTVILCIPPFGAEARHSIKFAGIFKDYDILILEYKNLHNNTPLSLSPTFFRPDTIKMFSNTIEQAFNWLTHKKEYRTIIAHGQCYGAWILLESQANPHNKAFFNKIILDSCPLSLHTIFSNAYHNPRGVLSLGKKKSLSVIRAILNNIPFLKTIYTTIAHSLFTEISAAALIKEVQVPILFVHGSEDYLVTPEQFELLYNSVSHNDKSALITPFKHLHHGLKSKELYHHYILDFINKK